MKIALVGYGKMGHAIEKIAESRGHQVVLRITSANSDLLDSDDIRQADMAIEFTRPAVAKENVLKCLAGGVNVVCGTTGWNEGVAEANYLAQKNDLAFLQASNFSLGVNIFFELNKLLASLMNGHKEYHISIEETHHTQKKDAPSGTAISLAQQILDRNSAKKDWTMDKEPSADMLDIKSYRVDDVPGTHIVRYSSAIDDIELIHTAHNRDGFAYGAVLAAEFIHGKKGIFTMKDVLGIK